MTKGKRKLFFTIIVCFHLFLLFVCIRMWDLPSLPIIGKITSAQWEWYRQQPNGDNRTAYLIALVQMCFSVAIAFGFISHYRKRWRSGRGRVIDVVIPAVGALLSGVVISYTKRIPEHYIWMDLILTEIEALVVLALLLSEKPLAEEPAEQIE